MQRDGKRRNWTQTEEEPSSFSPSNRIRNTQRMTMRLLFHFMYLDCTIYPTVSARNSFQLRRRRRRTIRSAIYMHFLLFCKCVPLLEKESPSKTTTRFAILSSLTIQSNSISQDLDCHWQIVKLLPILFVYTDFAPFLHSVSYTVYYSIDIFWNHLSSPLLN